MGVIVYYMGMITLKETYIFDKCNCWSSESSYFRGKNKPMFYMTQNLTCIVLSRLLLHCSDAFIIAFIVKFS